MNRDIKEVYTTLADLVKQEFKITPSEDFELPRIEFKNVERATVKDILILPQDCSEDPLKFAVHAAEEIVHYAHFKLSNSPYELQLPKDNMNLSATTSKNDKINKIKELVSELRPIFYQLAFNEGLAKYFGSISLGRFFVEHKKMLPYKIKNPRKNAERTLHPWLSLPREYRIDGWLSSKHDNFSIWFPEAASRYGSLNVSSLDKSLLITLARESIASSNNQNIWNRNNLSKKLEIQTRQLKQELLDTFESYFNILLIYSEQSFLTRRVDNEKLFCLTCLDELIR